MSENKDILHIAYNRSTHVNYQKHIIKKLHFGKI